MKRPLLSLTHWGPFRAEVEDGRLVAALPLAEDPEPSPMLAAIPELVHSRTRVRAPAVREGWLRDGPGTADGARGAERFVEVGWEEALDLVAREIARVRDTHGAPSLFAGSYGWSSAGAFHHARTQLKRLMAAAGGYTGQVDNYSFAAGAVLLRRVLGNASAVAGPMSDWSGIAENTDLLVMFGGARRSNAQVATGGGVLRSPALWLDRLRERGARIVTLSPLRDDAPDGSDWIPVRPGTDTALMLAMAHVLADEGLADRAFLARYTVGAERFLASLEGRDPDWAEGVTGVPASTIRDLAQRLPASRTMLTAAWSLQRADRGEQPFWALVALASLVGQIGLPGGGVAFGLGSIGGIATPRRRLPVPRIAALPNPAGREIPVARVTDVLSRPGETIPYDGRRITLPDVRMVLWAGGNPFHHHQDLRRLERAWQRPETIVVAESAWTATARRADIVLPATTFAERIDIGASSKDRFIVAMDRLVPPQAGARDDFDIFRDVAARLGVEGAFSEGRGVEDWLRHLYDGAAHEGWPTYDELRTRGLHEIAPPEEPATLFMQFRADPHGHPLGTPSGRIELFSQAIADMGLADCAGLPEWRPPAEWLGAEAAARFPLHLLTNQPARRLHSQMDAGPVAEAGRIDGREPIRLAPSDAAARGIVAGDEVRVWNERGACRAGAVIDDAVMPGVVQMSTGGWYDPDPPGGDERRGNPNVLTRDEGTSSLAQGCSAQTALVEVERAEPTSAPPAHGAPEFVDGVTLRRAPD